MDCKKNLCFIFLSLIILFGVLGFVSANTIESSTMVFEGTLTPSGDGYEGIIDAIAGSYYVEEGDGCTCEEETCTTPDGGECNGGFDVYAKEGGTAYYDDENQGTIGSDHDAYSSDGGWGSFYSPDVADYNNYQINFIDNNWYLEFKGVNLGTPMSGEINWNLMYATETDVGRYRGEVPADPDANDGDAEENGGGSQAWDMDWTWGSEAIPLEYSGFDIEVTNIGGDDYRVTLTPANGAITNIDTGKVYDTIQDAINDASKGDTIELKDGTYAPFNVGDKTNLTIKAAEGENPQIIGTSENVPSNRRIINVNGDYTKIIGLTIIGDGNKDLDTGFVGISIPNSNVIIERNTVNDTLTGIQTAASNSTTSSGNQILDNTISNVLVGISLQNDGNYVDGNNITADEVGFGLASKSTDWGTNQVQAGEAAISISYHPVYNKYTGSIQDGINGANEGDIIKVDPGLFEELITIDKPLTLRGATYNVNKNGYDVPIDYEWNISVESVIQPPEEANDYSAIVDIVDTDDVTFEGFIVQELNAIGNIDDSLLRVYANTKEIRNIIVRNNIIGPFTNTDYQDGTHGRMGLYIVNHPYSDEYGVVDSIFSGNKIFNCKGNGNNIFIWSSYSNPSYGAPGPASMSGTMIEDNEIYGAHRSGIETAGGYSGLTIRNNKIHDNGGPTITDKPEIMFGNGIVLIRGSGDSHLEDNPGLGPEDLTITDNEIYNNQRNAIYMGPINKDYTITNNKIFNNGWDGIRLDFTALYHNPDFEEGDRIPWADQTENIIANNNEIYNNGEYEVRVIGVPTNGFILNAEDNWWGTNDGSEIATLVSENVDYNPWITQSSAPVTTTPNTPTPVDTTGTNTSITLTTSSNQTGTITVQQSSSDSHGGFGVSALGKFISIESTIPNEEISEVEIRIYYTDDELLASGIDETTLRLYWWNGDSWGEVTPSGVNTTGNYIWAITDHFSDYGGGGDPDEEGPIIGDPITIPLYPNCSYGTINNPILVQVEITDNGTGVNHSRFNWKYEGSAYDYFMQPLGEYEDLWQAILTIPPEDIQDGVLVEYKIYATDYANNTVEKGYNNLFTYDCSPPETNISISEPKYEIGEDVYVSGGAEITLNCTDTISGCNETYFMVKYGEEIVQDWTIYTGPLPIPEDAEDGTHIVYYYSTDNAGNEEGEKSQEVIVDNTAPNVSIVYPINGIIYNSSINQLNYSASDSGSGLSSCWYNNGTTNSTPGACSNFTLSGSVEGLNNWAVYANDSVGNLNSATVYFTQDTISPSLSYNADTPEDNSYLNENSILINVSVTEENLDSVVLNLDGVNESITNNDGAGNYWINKIDLSDGNHSFYVWANDSVGHFNSTETRTVIIDTINPLISYTTGTPEDNANLSQDYVYVNVSLTELNFANITFSLYNSTGIVNSTNYNTEIKEINWTSLNEGRYSYNITVYDLAGNKNSTETREILLDTTGPSIEITNIKEGDDIFCFQSVTASINDEGSGVDITSVYATITNSSGSTIANQTMVYDSSRDLWDTTFSGLCSETPVGDYTIEVVGYDIAGNNNSDEKGVYFPSVVAVFSEPQTCNVDSNTGGTCTLSFSFWIRGGNAIMIDMSDIVGAGELSPTEVNATIFNDKGSAAVGNVDADGDPMWNGGILNVNTPVGYFNLDLTLPANFTASTSVDYYIKPVIV